MNAHTYTHTHYHTTKLPKLQEEERENYRLGLQFKNSPMQHSHTMQVQNDGVRTGNHRIIKYLSTIMHNSVKAG